MSTSIEYRMGSFPETIHQRPHREGVQVEMDAYLAIGKKQTETIDLKKSADYSTFISNYECWTRETSYRSLNNTDSEYYRALVKMGNDVVPFIYEKLKEGPTSLVHVLDEIYNYPIPYNGYVSLKDACDIWRSILQEIEIN